MTKRKMVTYKPKQTFQRDTIVVDNPYMTIPFGKHKGMTYQDILETNPGYILWLHDAKICSFPEATLEIAEIWASEREVDKRLFAEAYYNDDLPF